MVSVMVRYQSQRQRHGQSQSWSPGEFESAHMTRFNLKSQRHDQRHGQVSSGPAGHIHCAKHRSRHVLDTSIAPLTSCWGRIETDPGVEAKVPWS